MSTVRILFALGLVGCGPATHRDDGADGTDTADDQFPPSTLCSRQNAPRQPGGSEAWRQVTERGTCSHLAADQAGTLYRAQLRDARAEEAEVERMSCADGSPLWTHPFEAPPGSRFGEPYLFGLTLGQGVLSVATVYAENQQRIGMDFLDAVGDSSTGLQSNSGLSTFSAFAIDDDDHLWVALASTAAAGFVWRIERWDGAGAIVDAVEVDFAVEYLAVDAGDLLVASHGDEISVLRESNAGDWGLAWTIGDLDHISGLGLREHSVYALAETSGVELGSGDWTVHVFDEDGRSKRDFVVGLPVRHAVECAHPTMRVDGRGGVAVAFCVRDASGADPAQPYPDDKVLNHVYLEKYDATGALSWHVEIASLDGEHSNIDICDLAVAPDDSVLLTTQAAPFGYPPRTITTSRFAP
jgi:hypothetical protein